MSRYTDPVPEYTNSSGDVLSNGLLYFYDSGTNSTKITYADVNESIANPQPLVLNGDGSVPNCFYSGSAKVVLADENHVQIWERDPVTSGSVGAIGTDWDSVSIYDINSVVEYGGVFWSSIINGNQNNIPSSVATAWTQFYLLKKWNTNESYSAGDPVVGSDSIVYTSLAGSNLGNNPVGDAGVNWVASNGFTSSIPDVNSGVRIDTFNKIMEVWGVATLDGSGFNTVTLGGTFVDQNYNSHCTHTEVGSPTAIPQVENTSTTTMKCIGTAGLQVRWWAIGRIA